MDWARLPDGWHRAPRLRVWVLVQRGVVQALLERGRAPDDAWLGACGVGWRAPEGHRHSIVGHGLESTMRQIEHHLRDGGPVDRTLLEDRLAQAHTAGGW